MAIYKNPNGSYKKRLKSLDEPTNIKIADTKKLNKQINKLAKKSKTYKHNQEVLKKLKIQNNIKKEPMFMRLIKKISKFSIFCLKCIACFIIGMILLSIIYLILN